MDFLKGEVLIFNKPYGWTSFQLVKKVKNIIEKSINKGPVKTGHAGTLDPLATGLMIICTGGETKNIEYYQNLEKEYIAKVRLGATTPSFDLETNIDQYYSYENIKRENLEEALKKFKGEIYQDPPVYSAKMINGIRAYHYARKGKRIKLSGNKIVIYSIDLIDFNLPYFKFKIICSKGTYIRALARDIGIALKSGAHLVELLRSRIGEFKLENSITIEEFERNLVFL
jgi:tRNA pseudouridine55 synthase